MLNWIYWNVNVLGGDPPPPWRKSLSYTKNKGRVALEYYKYYLVFPAPMHGQPLLGIYSNHNAYNACGVKKSVHYHTLTKQS